MKFLFFFFFILSIAQAASISGEWKLKVCTQTQLNGRQGFVMEKYVFEESGSYEFVRDWFTSSTCEGAPTEVDSEIGFFKLGKENTNNGFNPAGTQEIDFTTLGKTDLGIIWTNKDSSELRLSRGTPGSPRNTMLSFFIYRK